MRATILPEAVILTKSHRASVSMDKGCIVTRVLPLAVSYFHYQTIFMFM